MKNYRSIRNLFNIGILLVFMFSSLVPAAATLAAPAQAKLTVVNRSSTSLRIWLSGPATYRLSIAAGQTKTYAINRGVYKMTASGCGMTATGTLDMSINRTLVLPICGGRVSVNDPHTIDLGKLLKIVKIEIINKSTGVATVVFKGPAVYMLTLAKNADKEYTVAKGSYKLTIYACGQTFKRNFTADKGKKFTITCP